MEFKKLTATEILEIIKNNYSESDFAYNEWLEANIEIPQEVEDKADVAFKAKREFWESIKDKLPISYQEREDSPLTKQYREMKDDYDIKEDYILNTLGLGRVVEVEQHGGEDQGSYWYSVKHFIDHDVYIKITGYYSSYNGTDFYDGYGCEVRPTEKTITVFE